MSITDSGRYPLSTASGDAIPLDVVRPLGFVSIAFITGSDTATLTLPDDTSIISCITDQDCIIGFGVAPGAVSDRVVKDSVSLVSKVMHIAIAPISLDIRVRGISQAGTLLINIFDSWEALFLNNQSERR